MKRRSRIKISVEHEGNLLPSKTPFRTARRIRIDTSKGSDAISIEVYDAEEPGHRPLEIQRLTVRWVAGGAAYADIVYADGTYDFVEVV